MTGFVAGFLRSETDMKEIKGSDHVQINKHCTSQGIAVAIKETIAAVERATMRGDWSEIRDIESVVNSILCADKIIGGKK